MKIGLRKITPRKIIARNTYGQWIRNINKQTHPFLYNKKGYAWIKNPRKYIYNKIYHRLTFSIFDIFKLWNEKKFLKKNEMEQTETEPTP